MAHTAPHSDGSGEREMVLVLTAILSYRALRGRRDSPGAPLRPDEQARLAELDRVFSREGGPAGDDDRPAFLLRLDQRVPLQLEVEVAAPGEEPCAGLLTNLSVGGFFVECAAGARLGEVLRFRFVDREAGRCWLFSGVVEWQRGGPRALDPGLGVRFDGVPVELLLGSRASGRFPVAA